MGFGGMPRLVDIISAVPEEHKKALLPKLKARPIRTASGVRSHQVLSCVRIYGVYLDRRCGGDVQTT